jgi:purine-nucleoside phosphorylase
MPFDYDFYRKSADYVLDRIDFTPEIAIILGSALGDLADRIENPIVVDYADIPNYPVSTVHSHAGKLILGTFAGKKVVCMAGRFHYYEGYDFEQLAAPIRLFKLLGVHKTILTNASGAVNPSYKPGDIMIISDHINLMGASPMRGKNIEEFGPRFFDIGDMYTKSLRETALELASDSGLVVHEGVYQFFCGPHFESPAEIRAARILGADAVGMSTVWEAITAAHCNMPLLGLSVITNMAAGVLQQALTTTEVNETAHRITSLFQKYIENIVRSI